MSSKNKDPKDAMSVLLTLLAPLPAQEKKLFLLQVKKENLNPQESFMAAETVLLAAGESSNAKKANAFLLRNDFETQQANKTSRKSATSPEA